MLITSRSLGWILLTLIAAGCHPTPPPSGSTAGASGAAPARNDVELVLPWREVAVKASPDAKVSWRGQEQGEPWDENGDAVVETAAGIVTLSRHSSEVSGAERDQLDPAFQCKAITWKKDGHVVSCNDKGRDVFSAIYWRTVGDSEYVCHFSYEERPGADAVQNAAAREHGRSLAEHYCESLVAKSLPPDPIAAIADPCERQVARAKKGEVDNAEQRKLDPLCQWRVSDLEKEWMIKNRPDLTPDAQKGKYDGTWAENMLPGEPLARTILDAIKKQTPRMESCLAFETPEGTTRVRFEFDRSGKLTSVLPDYRLPAAQSAGSCLATAFAGMTFPKPQNGEPAVLVARFKTKVPAKR